MDVENRPIKWEFDKTMECLAITGQVQHFVREFPTRFLFGFCGWLLGILTGVYLTTI